MISIALINNPTVTNQKRWTGHINAKIVFLHCLKIMVRGIQQVKIRLNESQLGLGTSQFSLGSLAGIDVHECSTKVWP